MFCFWLLVSLFKLGTDHTLENHFWTAYCYKKGEPFEGRTKTNAGTDLKPEQVIWLDSGACYSLLNAP